jgi:uncharacterized protein YggE
MKKYNLLLTSCLFWLMALPANATQFPDQANISVSGVAEIEVKPDTVTVEFQAIAIENTGDSAKSIVDKRVNNVLSQLSSNGFDQALLTRADLQLRTEYEFIGQKRVPIGVKATRNLSYQLDDVSKLNTFLQLLVKSEISSIGQIHYALKEPAKWQLKARNLAVKDSIAKAKNLANSYQMSLGHVYSINYQSNNPQPILMRAMSNEESVPSYQNNKITLSERVDAVFLLNTKK